MCGLTDNGNGIAAVLSAAHHIVTSTMILLEEETLQRPKLPTDPSTRAPFQVNTSECPPGPNTTLPDYEASQAQHPSPHKRRFYRRLWHTRVGKVISSALAIYSAIFVIIGIPAFVLRWKSSHRVRWHGDDSFSDYGPLPLPPPTQLEPVALHGEPNTTAAMASMHLAFPLSEGIILRMNTSSNNLKGHVSGSLRVNMNPDKNVSGIVLVASPRCSSSELLKASSVCLTSFRNTTELMIHIPDMEENRLDMNLQLLLPWTPAPINFNMFVTHLPMFNQSFGDLGPHVAFRNFELSGSNSAITVDSVRASSIMVQTSGAEISGNFSASENIFLDNVNGAIYTNVLLFNNRKSRRPTKLKVETGNGYCSHRRGDHLVNAYHFGRPIVAQVNLQVDDRRYFSSPRKHPDFVTVFKTFNAPMNVSIAHVAGSDPARLGVIAENTQGAMAMTLDSVYAGLFELRTKEATTLVQEIPATPGATDSSLGGEHELHFEHISSEWTRGWIGDDQRPKNHHHHEANRIKLLNSLGPIELWLARLRPSTAIRR
ncbi:hypothetical protein BJY52DRAFT_921658 [Lactarius psammicola]|nr:hypothetical protein BJY52DRAFT_921658 [Lactarius psammicola]